MKKILALVLVFALACALSACGAASAVISSSNDKPDADSAKSITLNGDSISADSGVKVNGTTATIAASFTVFSSVSA